MRISDWSSDVCSSDLTFSRLKCAICSMKCTSWSRSGPLGPTDNEFRSLGAGAPAPVVDPVSGRGSEVAMLHRVPEPTRTQAPTGPRTQICGRQRSEEHTSELQSLMRISYAVFCL